MRAFTAILLTLALVVPAAAVATEPPEPSAPEWTGLRAGAAKVDATWKVGASAGQYAGKGPGMVDTHGNTIEPHHLSTTQHPSHGIHSRDWVRALVVEGADGTRFATVANDLYIPQDLLNRRVASILEDHDRLVGLGLADGAETGITPENLMISVSHNHTSPYYSSPSWGVWAFQDVFDIRFFEHYATALADAVIAAAGDLRPARVGAATATHTLGRRHSYGPEVGDDGLPAGYPQPLGEATQLDPDLTVVAVDDMSDPDDPRPLATWLSLGLHPEHLKTPQLLSTEYVGATYRFLDREVGGVTLFSQNDTGSVEPAREARAHEPHERQEFSGAHLAQMERQARQIADTVLAARADIAGGEPVSANQVVPFETDAPVKVTSLRFAPPGIRAFPTVSSCRAEKAFRGNPGVPVVGLPNCAFAHGENGENPLVTALKEQGLDPAVTYNTLRETGVPVPDNVGAPSYTGLQETVQVHLMAVRIGEIAVTVCPCEQFADQSLNIKSRLAKDAPGFYYGFDWTANHTLPGWEPGVSYRDEVLGWCEQDADTTWTCRNPHTAGFAGLPSHPDVFLEPVSDEAFRRMKAQIYNDAAGWDDLDNALHAESESVDVDDVWGNFTHELLQDVMDDGGYELVMTVGMTNDYWGYIPPYREFQAHDHYRKALAGLGPHSMDFLATRLSRMAASLKGGPEVELTPKDLAYHADYAHQGARAEAIGRLARTWLSAYEAQLPADGEAPGIVEQPAPIERFDAARVAWVGGSNYVDSPHAVVQRCVTVSCDPDDPGHWEDFGNGAGDVQVLVHYPGPADLPAYRAGQFPWIWEATFEAFASDVPWPDAQGRVHTATPPGTYRFVVDGAHRSGAPPQATPYRLVSDAFEVAPWRGLEVVDVVADAQTLSFAVGPVSPYAPETTNTRRGPVLYPDSYASPFPYIDPQRELRRYGAGGPLDEWFCWKCAFRTWADTGAVAGAAVTAVDADGTETVVVATPAGDRWVAELPEGTVGVRVDAGQVVDEFGNVNGQSVSLLPSAS